MANDIVYERDYREVHKIMTARTYTEEKEEAFQLALQSGVYRSIGERIHELPHVLNPIKKAAYEKCLVVLEKYAAQWGGYIKGIVSYRSYDASIELDLPFHEFIEKENMDDLRFIAQNARYVVFTPLDDGRIKMVLRFDYFEEVGDVETIIEEELQKRPDLCDALQKSHNSEVEQILSDPIMRELIEPQAEKAGMTFEEYVLTINRWLEEYPDEFMDFLNRQLKEKHDNPSFEE